MPAGQQRPRVREKYPALEIALSRHIASDKWAISHHAADKASAFAGLTSNSTSSNLVAPRSAGDHGAPYVDSGQLRGGSDGEGGRGDAGHATPLPVNSKLGGELRRHLTSKPAPCAGTRHGGPAPPPATGRAAGTVEVFMDPVVRAIDVGYGNTKFVLAAEADPVQPVSVDDLPEPQ